MGEHTGVEWAHHTFNPWHGCTKVSPACDHCYAEREAHRRGTGWGPKAERRFFGDKHWKEPLIWDRKAAAAGQMRRVFCASMADIGEINRALDAERARLWDLIQATPHLEWLLLTKRIETFLDTASAWNKWAHFTPGNFPNVRIGTTVENQDWANQRLPALIRTGFRNFVSYEPALGPIEFTDYLGDLDWIIAGGESGPGARPPDPDWFRSVRDACVRSQVPFFFKQWGEYWPAASLPGAVMLRLGKKAAGSELDGREWKQFPVNGRNESRCPDCGGPLDENDECPHWYEPNGE